MANKPSTNENISKIKETRINAGLTQEQMSKWLEIPIDTIKGWDNGRRKPLPWVEKLVVEKLETYNNKKQ